jgi:hypothetical protein
MAVRTFTLDRWVKAVAAAIGKPAHAELNGDSPGTVAAELGVSRQAVHQAVQRGALDAVIVNDARGKLQMFMIPRASVERYKQSPWKQQRRA